MNAAANIVKDVDVLINNGGTMAVGDYINNDPGGFIRPGREERQSKRLPGLTFAKRPVFLIDKHHVDHDVV